MNKQQQALVDQVEEVEGRLKVNWESTARSDRRQSRPSRAAELGHSG